MRRILEQIGDWIAGSIFPQNNEELNADKFPENARLIRLFGDGTITYPCPAYSFFAYKDPAVRQMIWKLKYRGDLSVSKFLAKIIYDQACEEFSDNLQWSNFTRPLLVPVPISKKKLRSRGFNQSAAICKAIFALDNGHFFDFTPDVLNKIKDTPSQARVKDRIARLINLKDSFLVKDKSLVKNRNLIILDDVLTTGSTLMEATNTLKSAGAKNIIWLTVAH